MKITFCMIVFNGAEFLEPCLRSVLPFGNVVAAEGPVAFWKQRGYTTSTDGTNAILDKYGITTLHSQWDEKDAEANAALALVPPDTDFVFCLDSDEIWKAETLESICDLLRGGSIDSMAFKPYSFYGGFDRYMTGFEQDFEWHRIQRYYPGAKFATHRPPTINAPDGRPWRLHRHLNHERTAALCLRFFHYSYVFPSQMRAKAEYYAQMGGNIPGYFDNVYKPWVLGDDVGKLRVEKKYDGVHNWKPSARGPCWTTSYKGEHPGEIQAIMPELQARLTAEVEALRD
jgi:glycosyltransferase involved in cell wall biosynthesis